MIKNSKWITSNGNISLGFFLPVKWLIISHADIHISMNPLTFIQFIHFDIFCSCLHVLHCRVWHFSYFSVSCIRSVKHVTYHIRCVVMNTRSANGPLKLWISIACINVSMMQAIRCTNCQCDRWKSTEHKMICMLCFSYYIGAHGIAINFVTFCHYSSVRLVIMTFRFEMFQ